MRRALLVLFAMQLLFCSGCAVFNRNNTPALNFVEEHLLPKENPARSLSFPLTVPAGFVAGALDMVLFHPLSVAGDAWDDTNEILWEKLDWDHQFVTTTVLNAPRVAVMPIIFTADFLARSSFDISRRGGDVRLNMSGNKNQKEERKADLKSLSAEMQEALDQHDNQLAFAIADQILSKEPNNQEASVVKAYVYLERRNLAALAAMPPHLPFFLDDRFCKLFADLLSNGSPPERLQALTILERSYFVLKASRSAQGNDTGHNGSLFAALEQNLADNDRAIRMKTMQLLGKYQRTDRASRALLAKLAKGDDPVLAAVAAGLLR
jgi:hypothetical protein